MRSLSAKSLFGAPLVWILCAHPAAGQVQVSSFGAVGDGKTDDTAAIQRAINSIAPGQTLVFGTSSNTYLISAQLILQPNVIYSGSGTIEMSQQAPAHTAIAQLPYNTANNVTITGITLDANGVGGGIQIDVNGGGSSAATNFTLQNVVIRNTTANPAGPWDGAVYDSVGLANSTISNNHFTNCGIGISINDPNNVNIANNRFETITVGDAIQLVFAPVPFPYGQKIRITGNTGQHLGRMGVELFPNGGNTAQNSLVTGVVINDNTFCDWIPNTSQSEFGISIMAGQAASVQNNKLIGPPTGYGVELGAPQSMVAQNTVQGFGTGIILEDSNNSTVTGNLLVSQVFDGIEFSNATGSRASETITNNSIINAQIFGIYSNTTDWGGTIVSGNLISRMGGAFAGDSAQTFTGISITPPNGPITITSNMISQTATGAVSGFDFIGIRVNGSAGQNSGSSYQSNTVGSSNSSVESTGVYANSNGSLDGATIEGNSFNNLTDASSGVNSVSAVIDGNFIYNCLQLGPLFSQ